MLWSYAQLQTLTKKVEKLAPQATPPRETYATPLLFNATYAAPSRHNHNMPPPQSHNKPRYPTHQQW